MDLEFFKAYIQNKIKESTANNVDLFIDMDGDESDEIQGNLLMGMAYEQSSRVNKKIRELYEALSKIDRGEFGICEECEEYISVGRLKAYPETRYCISCAEAIEKNTKLYR